MVSCSVAHRVDWWKCICSKSQRPPCVRILSTGPFDAASFTRARDALKSIPCSRTTRGTTMPEAEQIDWKTQGVRVIPAQSLDTNTPQTPGMSRAAAINYARVGAQKIWAGTVTIEPNAKTGPHHHGSLESVIYVVDGRARMRWGAHLEYVAEGGPGDFIYVPPYVPHQEINASVQEPLECVVVRSDQETIVVNLDIEPAEKPESVAWIDPIHRRT